MNSHLLIREKQRSDKSIIDKIVREEWGSEKVVSRGQIYMPAELPGIIAEIDAKIAGFLTYHIGINQIEVITINSFLEGVGIGSALLNAVKDIARENGCRRVWMITTNDNKKALKFYEKNGYRVVEIHKDAIKKSRILKPEIPLFGFGGIPINDEIELEKLL